MPAPAPAPRPDFERFGTGFQTRLRAGFAALAAAEPDRVRLVDGSGSEAEVAERVRAVVDAAASRPAAAS